MSWNQNNTAKFETSLSKYSQFWKKDNFKWFTTIQFDGWYHRIPQCWYHFCSFLPSLVLPSSNSHAATSWGREGATPMQAKWIKVDLLNEETYIMKVLKRAECRFHILKVLKLAESGFHSHHILMTHFRDNLTETRIGIRWLSMGDVL